MEFLSSDRINEILNETLSEELRKVLLENQKRANCIGVLGNLTEYRDFEREDIMIVEQRGVAAYDYRDSIRNICGFIDYLIQEGDYRPKEIDINNHDFLKINLAEEVILIIQFTNGEELAEYLDKYTIVNNGIAQRIYISLEVNPFQHNDKVLSQYLYHELNHCKDDINRRIHNKSTLGDKLNGVSAEIKYQQAFTNTLKRNNIATLIYQLFVDTEQNAYTAQLYGELDCSNTTRNQFRDIFKNTHTYKTYDGLLQFVKLLETHTGWEKEAMEYFNKKFTSIESFRKWFVNRANNKLRNMYKNLCKVASLYYDTKESETTN